MNQNPIFPINSNVANMNWNLNQDENHAADGLDLSLYVGTQPPSMPQQNHQQRIIHQPLTVLEPPPQQLPVVRQEVPLQQYHQEGTIYQPPPQQLPLLQPEALPQQHYQQGIMSQPQQEVTPLRQSRRRNRTLTLPAGKTEIIPAPFPWAATKRAAIYSFQELQAKQIFTISDQVQCKKCEHQFEMEYNLREKFEKIQCYITDNGESFRDRAPDIWKDPILPSCRFCGHENCVKPIISDKKKSINWLFLFLGQMLGCLTLAQLKYFCKHSNIHRTGAKDRLLFSTYICLYKQLCRTEAIDR